MVCPEILALSQIMQLIYCIIGLPGNLISGAVFLRKNMHSSYTGLVVGLAVFDSLIMIKGLINASVTLGGVQINQEHVTMFFFRWICDTGSKYFTVAIAAERFFVVFYPIQAHKNREKRGLWMAGVLVGLVWAVAGFSYIYSKYGVGYHIYTAIVLNFIPFPVVVGLSGALWWKLRQAATDRKKMTRKERKGLSVTRMLMAVVIFFGFCCFIEFIRRILTFAGYYQDPYTYYDYTISHLSDHFYLINSSVNFIIYGVMSKRFRGEARDIFACKGSREIVSLTTNETSTIP